MALATKKAKEMEAVLAEATTVTEETATPVAPVIKTVLSAYDANVIKGVRACLKMNESILFIGETGTGKTTLANELAKEQGKKLHRVSVNGSMGVDEILGKWLAKDGSTYWIDGILTKAVREGDWVIFDEMNAMLPEMGFALHSLLDDAKTITLAEKDGEVIPAHKEFRFFGSMNPGDDYAGTKEVNMALMSRFGGVFHIEVFASHHEHGVLVYNGVDTTHATKLVNLANELRKMRTNGDLYTFVSTRDIIQAGKLATEGLAIPLAIQFSMLNKMTAEEREELKKSTVMKDYLAGKIFKTEEQEKAEQAIEKANRDVEAYKKAYQTKDEELKKAQAEIDLLKKTPAGLTGIDPRKLLLLKKLGMGKELGIE